MNTENTYEDFVDHPRYGKSPIISGFYLEEHEIPYFYRKRNHVNGTAVKADLGKQHRGMVHTDYYLDLIKDCPSCNKKFILFAQEQKYWYEDLQFMFPYTHKVKCTTCRRVVHEHKNHIKIFSKYKHKLDTDILESNELTELIESAIHLKQEKYFENQDFINRLINLAIEKQLNNELINELKNS